MKYMIEVQKLCEDLKDDIVNESYEHIGYINMIFNSVYELKKYVKKYNPHLRIRGNSGGRRHRAAYYTTTDLVTKMRFVLRTYRNEKLTLLPF